jgi:hypothetical protein
MHSKTIHALMLVLVVLLITLPACSPSGTTPSYSYVEQEPLIPIAGELATPPFRLPRSTLQRLSFSLML